MRNYDRSIKMMSRIMFKQYKRRIDNGEITIAEAIALAGEEGPVKCRSFVVELLSELI